MCGVPSISVSQELTALLPCVMQGMLNTLPSSLIVSPIVVLWLDLNMLASVVTLSPSFEVGLILSHSVIML